MVSFTFSLDKNGQKALYLQLYEHIVREIQNGNLSTGEKLPSKRMMAKFLNISQSTIETAYEMLLEEGYIDSVAKVGYFVLPYEQLVQPEIRPEAEKKREKTESAVAYDLSTSAVNTDLFPFATWAKLMKETMYHSPELLSRGDVRGDFELRHEIAKFLRGYRGVFCSEEQIIVGAGIEYLLGLLFSLFEDGFVLGVEDPGYKKVYEIVNNQKIHSEPIALDTKGICLEALERSRANVLCITPSHQFPLGITMPVSRRNALLKWAAQKENRYILEDDYDSEFRYSIRPIPAIQGLDGHGKVVYLGTFSRSLAPSIRIAYMVLPYKLSEKFEKKFSRYASTVSRFEQHTLAKFIADGYYMRHIGRAQNSYKKIRDLMLQTLKQEDKKKILRITGENAGLHFVLSCPLGENPEMLKKRLLEKGIRVMSISDYVHGECSAFHRSSFVIGYAGLRQEEVPYLCRCLKESFYQWAGE